MPFRDGTLVAKTEEAKELPGPAPGVTKVENHITIVHDGSTTKIIRVQSEGFLL